MANNPENVVPYGKHNHLMAQHGGPDAYDRMVYGFGYEDGQQTGYSEGYHDGRDSGHIEGFLDGSSSGHQEGFRNGTLITACVSVAFCFLTHYLRTKWQEHKLQKEAEHLRITDANNIDTNNDTAYSLQASLPASSVNTTADIS